MKYPAKNIVAITVAVLISTLSFGQGRYNNNPPPQAPAAGPAQGPRNFDPTGFIMVTIGGANPLGNYAAQSGTGYGGYASGGITESILAGIPVANTNIGVSLMYAGYANIFDINAYASNVIKSDPYNTYYDFSNDDYSESAIMAGVFYTWPVHRISFDLRAMGGIMIGNLPGITYYAYATDPLASNDFQWDYASSRSIGLGYDVGGDIRVRLNRSFCISLNADYVGASLPYSTYNTYTDQYGYQTINSVTGNIPVELFNISLGLGYQFR